MTVNTSEPMAKLVNKELLISRRFQMDPKEIKCPLQRWQKHESIFPIVGFLAQQILGIVESQIETGRIFPLDGIFTNLRRCRLQTENLEKLVFVNKNWPNDTKVGWKSSSDIVEFMEMDEQRKRVTRI
jgi:hypothetical protein